jgi:hypothetical protein
MPLVWLIIASLLGIISSLIGWPKMNWPMITSRLDSLCAADCLRRHTSQGPV